MRGPLLRTELERSWCALPPIPSYSTPSLPRRVRIFWAGGPRQRKPKTTMVLYTVRHDVLTVTRMDSNTIV